ncbi:hypothetical protein [Legionella erythra]|uniref:Uncharacterized protein n=1 Tax=Legionella erythra TaxID=448 RepID=A0A0W0TVW7_LEGER|nr:hypothetical protein [Legionella erythra]KTC99859.1 hypothetical protein Lery_0213 [Legionella erythra]
MFLYKKHLERLRKKMRSFSIPLSPTHALHLQFTAETRRQFGFSFLQRVSWHQQKGTVLGQFSHDLLIWSDADKPVLIPKKNLPELTLLHEHTYSPKLTEVIKNLFNEDIVILAKNMADLERFEEKIPLLYQEGNLELTALAEASWGQWLSVAPLVLELLATMFREYVDCQEQSFLEVPKAKQGADCHTAIMQFTFNTLLDIKPDYADKTVMAPYFSMANQLAHYFYTQALMNPVKKNEVDNALDAQIDLVPDAVAALVCAMMGAGKDTFIHHACYLLWIKELFPDGIPGLMPHQFNLDEWYRDNPDKVIVLYRQLMADPHFIACNDRLQKNRQPAVQFEIAKLRYFYVHALFKTSSPRIPPRQDALHPLLQLVRNNWPDAVQFLIQELNGPAFNDRVPCFYLDRDVALALSHYYGRSFNYSDNELAWSFWQKGKTMPSPHARLFDQSHIKTKLEVLFERGDTQHVAIQRLKDDAQAGHPVALQYLRETSHHVPRAALACLEFFAGKQTLTSFQYDEAKIFYSLASQQNRALAARWYSDILKHHKKLTLKTLLVWVEEGHEFAIEALELKIKEYLKKGEVDAIEKKILPLLEREAILKNLLPEIVILLIQYMDKVWRDDFADDERDVDEQSPVFCNEWLLTFLHRLKRMPLSNKKQLIPFLLKHTAALLTDEGHLLLLQLVAQEYSFSELAVATWLKSIAALLINHTQGKSNLFKLKIDEFLLNNPHVVKALAVCQDSRMRLTGNPFFAKAVKALEGSSDVPDYHEEDTVRSSIP